MSTTPPEKLDERSAGVEEIAELLRSANYAQGDISSEQALHKIVSRYCPSLASDCPGTSDSTAYWLDILSESFQDDVRFIRDNIPHKVVVLGTTPSFQVTLKRDHPDNDIVFETNPEPIIDTPNIKMHKRAGVYIMNKQRINWQPLGWRIIK